MQRIIQINIAGRVLPIEEDAYFLLKDYLTSLERQFVAEPGKAEILQDIEGRIAELFTIRLQSGAPAIDKPDVQKVVETLGHADALGNDAGTRQWNPYLPVPYEKKQQRSYNKSQRLFRNPFDKMIGGVCSGLGVYFDVDPIIVRLVWAVLFFFAGVGLLAYIIAWIVIPPARSVEELEGDTNEAGAPVTFHTITRNVAADLQDLKKRAEGMSRDLKGFFSRR